MARRAIDLGFLAGRVLRSGAAGRNLDWLSLLQPGVQHIADEEVVDEDADNAAD